MKIKNFIKKIRIFKRLRRYKDENNQLKDMLIKRRHTIEDLQNELKDTVKIIIENEEVYKKLEAEYKELEIKKKNGEKYISEFAKRRDEVIKRLQMPMTEIPDLVLSGNMADYKYWLAEPFIKDKYAGVTKQLSKEVFVDIVSSLRGFGKFLEKDDKNEIIIQEE